MPNELKKQTVMIFAQIDLCLRKVLTRGERKVVIRKLFVHFLVDKAISPYDAKAIKTFSFPELSAPFKPHPGELRVIFDTFTTEMHLAQIRGRHRSNVYRMIINLLLSP